jgi:hypothetical protein
VRLLPSAKVCFLGGCPRSGRNQNLHRRNKRSRRPQSRRAQPLFRSRCLRAMGEKGKGVATNSADWRVVGRRGEKLGTETTFGLSHDWRSVRRRSRTRGNLRLAWLPLGGDSRNRGEKRASWRNYETAASLGPKKTAGRKKLAYRRGETVSLGKRDAVLRRCRSARSRRRTNCGQPIGCPPRGFPLSESRLRRRRCGPRFDWEFPFRFLASAVCSHGRTPHLQGQASRSK